MSFDDKLLVDSDYIATQLKGNSKRNSTCDFAMDVNLSNNPKSRLH